LLPLDLRDGGPYLAGEDGGNRPCGAYRRVMRQWTSSPTSAASVVASRNKAWLTFTSPRA